jgi:uncharacterized protein (TIGR03435 family)
MQQMATGAFRIPRTCTIAASFWRTQPMFRDTCLLLVVCTFALWLPPASSQNVPVSANLPAFDAATIKPPDPGAAWRKVGFYGEPGGRIFFGGKLKMLVEYAFNLQEYQVTGGPEWITSHWFEINAVPPDSSASRRIKVRNAEPTAEQRLMLQSLLRDRFGFKFHLESKDGEVYILTRASKSLQLKLPKDPEADPRAVVVMKAGGIADGEAFGANTTMEYMAQMLSHYLQLPVVDETGISGSYDYNLPPNDPENHDPMAAVLSVVDRLGLTIKRGRGPIQTLVVDHVEQPSEN